MSEPAGGRPDRIGPYLITGVLGEGGMGVVYDAEQLEPVRRRVALKLIRGGADFEDVAARFDAERQALAVMEHPCIARILDGGTTDQGSPYFVMEYVDGTPLTEYCDERRLGIPERLELFGEVCDAIQHAHQKGIIHRDLKPSNILVTEQAGAPQPRVIDFGIAKATGVRLTDETLATAFGAMLGTPAYMSPEQAEGADLDVDTRADVYALGVILYELLTGRVPLDPEELGFVPFLAQLITDAMTPPTPSRALETSPDAGAIAQRRATTAERLARKLAGDLDWVVMRATETDRERRYASARELGDDVGRVLRDEPVLARPPSTSYRMQKFVRRNRAAVIAGAAAVLLLVAGTIASTVGFLRALAAERVAEDEAERAVLEAATATEVSDFLVGLFQAANPAQAGRPDVTAREILDQGVERVGGDLADQPVVQARLLSTMADAYQGMGDVMTAEGLYRRVLPIREQALGADHADVGQALLSLLMNNERARFAGSHPFETDPEYRAEVLEWARRAVDINERHLAADTTAWMDAVSMRANLLSAAGQAGEGEASLTSAVARFEEALEPDNEHVVTLRDLLGRFYLNNARFLDGVEQFELVLAIEEARSEPDAERISAYINNIALGYDEAGYPERSVPLYEQNLEAARQIGGASEDPITYWNAAILFRNVGRHLESAGLWEELATAERDVWGERHPYPVSYDIYAGENLVAARELDRGLEVLTSALPILRDAYERGEAGPQTLRAFWIGYASYAAARIARGEDPASALIELAGPTPELRREAMSGLGTIYARDLRGTDDDLVPDWLLEYERRDEDALVAFRRGLEFGAAEEWEDRGEWHGRIRGAHDEYARTLLRLGRGAQLERFSAEWVSTMRAFEGRDGPQTSEARRDAARLLWAGEPLRSVAPVESSRDAAIPLLERVLQDAEREEGDGMHLAGHVVRLVRAYERAGRTADAAALTDRLRSLFEARQQELETLAATGEIVPAAQWNTICRWAALAGLSDVAFQTCDPAVEAASGSERGSHHDSRAVARAVAGDLEGAIADFEAYLRTRSRISPAARQRQSWIESLRRGENPFTSDLLGALSM